jgi:TonB family protein
MIELTLILILGLAAAAVLRRQSAATRHWALTAAILCAALSPALGRLVPAWGVPAAAGYFGTAPGAPAGSIRLPTALAPQRGTPPSREPTATDARQRVAGLLIVLWAAGAAGSSALLLVGLARLRWLRVRARPVVSGCWRDQADALGAALGIRRPVRIVESAHPALLVTWGLWRPTILLPAGAASWNAARIRVVVAHELAHVWRADWLSQLAAETLRAVCWFNPVPWIVSRRLRRESEQACDDVVIGLGVAPAEYASHLVELARAASRHRHPALPAPAMARPGSLERRITAMLNSGLDRTAPGLFVRASVGAALLSSSVLAAALGADAQSFSTLSGSVLDPTNRPAPAATVTLTNVQTSAKYEVRSDASGRFEVGGLPPGEYALEARLPGFKALKGKVIVGGESLQKDISLELGTLTETIHVRGSRSTPAAASPAVQQAGTGARQPRPCEAAATGGNVRPPLKLKNVNPVYPAELQAGNVAGTVVLDATIDVDGTVRDVAVTRDPHPGLAQAAIDAVRQWEFTATLLNCDAVPVKMLVTITFSLEQ